MKIPSHISVKMYCPFSRTKQFVYFYPIELDGSLYLDINSFTGCDNHHHPCPECESCKQKAYKELMN